MKMKAGKEKIIGLFLTGLLFLPICVFAESGFLKTSISDIQNNPDRFYEKNVEVRAYFFKMDNIWVKSLDEPDKYIGLFVSKPERDISPFLGEYFGFIFVPQQIQAQLRLLKFGDKITVRGKCFEFKSISIDGPGIKASELLDGWGTQANPVAASLPVTRQEVISLIQANSGAAVTPATSAPIVAQPQASVSAKSETQKYNLHLNGNEYQGLTFGDEYTFGGIRFRVDKE